MKFNLRPLLIVVTIAPAVIGLALSVVMRYSAEDARTVLAGLYLATMALIGVIRWFNGDYSHQ